MTGLIVRSATPSDAAALCDVLNPIIAKGGSTAHLRAFDEERMRDHYIAPSGLISCVLAEEAGTCLGFQVLLWPNWPDHGFDDGWAIIATFVSEAARGKGVGQRLFEATLAAGRDAGAQVIDAEIRADNSLGLRFYDRIGFVDYRRKRSRLSDGSLAEKICKRFDL